MNARAALLLTLAALAGCASGPAPTALSSLRVAAVPDANYASATQVDLVFVSALGELGQTVSAFLGQFTTYSASVA